MKPTISAGRALGVPIEIHISLLAAPVLIAIAVWVVTGNWSSVLLALALAVLLSGCVLLHELGHALMAKRLRVETIDITLTLLGGFARFRLPEHRPLDEMRIALAGPAANACVAALIFSTAVAVGHPATPSGIMTGWDFWITVGWVNAALAGLNLLPILPLDGGRIVRSLLAARLGLPRATWFTARATQLSMLGLIVLAISQGVFVASLVLLAVMLLAERELMRVRFLDRRRRVFRQLGHWVVGTRRIPNLD